MTPHRDTDMYFQQSPSTLALLAVLSISFGNSTASFAQEGDARLKQRITALESENLALRKIIGEIQTVLKTIPEQTKIEQKHPSGLRIVVLPGEWDGSSLVDMRKVCESAGGSIMAQIGDDSFAPIIVQKDKSGPITLFRRGEGNEHIVRLNTGGRAWAQLAFQFAHEFCHIACNYRDVKNQQLWFEETLCECASLFALRSMATEWQTNPPYSNWKGYSTSLASYAEDRLKMHEEQNESLAHFYQANLSELEKNGTNRLLNGYMSVKLLPLFEANPGSWQTLRYINLGPAEENTSFSGYLSAWHDRVPEKHRSFIELLAAEFKVDLSTETPIR